MCWRDCFFSLIAGVGAVGREFDVAEYILPAIITLTLIYYSVKHILGKRNAALDKRERELNVLEQVLIKKEKGIKCLEIDLTERESAVYKQGVINNKKDNFLDSLIP
jgi:hypothetical protein